MLKPVISKETMSSHKVIAQPTHAHNVLAQKPTTTHEEKKLL